MTKIDLITGILGAGKTTFLRKYASYFIQQGYKIAILENDFGAVNIDMMLLQDLKSENCQLEMITGGCDADCHKRRFKTKLISLGMQHFDRIMIEPSGIFDMDEFFDILYESPLDKWFEIGSILGIIPAELDNSLSEQMRYLLASESACCGRLILSKLNAIKQTDFKHLPEKISNNLNQMLSEIQCNRFFQPEDFFVKNWENFTNQDYFDFSCAGYSHASYVKKFHIDNLKSEVHYFMHVGIPENQIAKIINAIMQDSNCGIIFRLKGSLPISDNKWLKINATKEKIDISPVPDGQAVLIVMGDSIHTEYIYNYIKSVNINPDFVFI
ncbi:MAG: GTPase (G3E family) [Oscillospiraceae bacterium]|nr:GTPase (G3E family) [Oscillospiraceae bacterium]